MARFWVSWWSGNYADEGCTKPPFDSWCSGIRGRTDTKKTGRDEESYCAVIDTDDKDAEARIIAAIKKHFPDAEMRFIELKANDWKPGNRFPGFDEKLTKLTKLRSECCDAEVVFRYCIKCGYECRVRNATEV